jgi:hypothetical protein
MGITSLVGLAAATKATTASYVARIGVGFELAATPF